MASSDDKDQQRAGIFVHKKIRRRRVEEDEASVDETQHEPEPPPERSGIMRPIPRRRPSEEFDAEPRRSTATPLRGHPVLHDDPEPEHQRRRTDDFEDPFADLDDPFAMPLGGLDEPELEPEPIPSHGPARPRRTAHETLEFAPPKDLLDFGDAALSPQAAPTPAWSSSVTFPSPPVAPTMAPPASPRRSAIVELEPADDFFDDEFPPSPSATQSAASNPLYDMYDPFAASHLGTLEDDDSIIELDSALPPHAPPPERSAAPSLDDAFDDDDDIGMGWGDLPDDDLEDDLAEHLDTIVGVDEGRGTAPPELGFGETAWARERQEPLSRPLAGVSLPSVSASPVAPQPPAPVPPVSRRVVLAPDWGTPTSESASATAGLGTRHAIDDFLTLTVESGAARLVLSVGARPLTGAERGLRTMSYRPLTLDDWNRLLEPLCGPLRWQRLRDEGSVSFFHVLGSGARFKVTAVRSRAGGCVTFVHLRSRAPSRTQLGLPVALEGMLEPSGGLVLIAAPPRHGKRTTLTAMVDAIVRRERRTMVVVDELGRFVFEGGLGDVHLVDPSVHSTSMAEAIRVAVRSGADTLAVAEPREADAVRAVVDAAAEGLLVLVTVQAAGPLKALDTLSNGSAELRAMLLDVLGGVVYQRQVRATDGGHALATACIPLDRDLIDGLEQAQDLEELLAQRSPCAHCLGLVDALADLERRRIASADAVLASIADKPTWAALLRARLSR